MNKSKIAAIATLALLTSYFSIAIATPESDTLVWIPVADLASNDTGQVAAELMVQAPWETDGTEVKVIYKIQQITRSPSPNLYGNIIIDCKQATVETIGTVVVFPRAKPRSYPGTKGVMETIQPNSAILYVYRYVCHPESR